VAWGALGWTSATPPGTSIALLARTGNTPVPDGTWSTFAPVANGGAIGGSARYAQYRADLATSDTAQTPVLQSVTLSYSATSVPSIGGFTPPQGAVGQSVVITGTNFTGATAVAFNGTSAAFTVTSATRITPSGAPSRAVDEGVPLIVLARVTGADGACGARKGTNPGCSQPGSVDPPAQPERPST